MSARSYNNDISAVGQKVADGAINGVTSVAKGDSDGEIVVSYRHQSLSSEVKIHALAQEIRRYPDENMFMLFTEDDSIPKTVADAIDTASSFLYGMTVYEMVTALSNSLEKALGASSGDAQEGGTLSSETKDAEDEDEDGDDNEDYDDYDDYGDEDEYDQEEGWAADDNVFGLSSVTPQTSGSRTSTSAASAAPPQLLRRIKRDLRLAKTSGYKIAVLQGLNKHDSRGMVSISIRLDKLSLSEETMEAWDVEKNDYFVLLIRFDEPYAPLEDILGRPAAHTHVSFRVGKCKRYKPHISNAARAFSGVSCVKSTVRETGLDPVPGQASTHDDREFHKIFISNSLDQYMNESFVSLMKLRAEFRYTWEEANADLMLRTGLGLLGGQGDSIKAAGSGDPMDIDSTSGSAHAPSSDHLTDTATSDGRSFPLVAMQFAMQYFMRCTEYCLRCHRKLEEDFGALRPYVCSDPLCLFQYLAMGFGPSIEHEILTEPYVVDLLVSLCYAAVQPLPNHWQPLDQNSPKKSPLPIRTLPQGLRLQVPILSSSADVQFKAKLAPTEDALILEPGWPDPVERGIVPGKWLVWRAPTGALKHAVVQSMDSATRAVHIRMTCSSSNNNWSDSSSNAQPGQQLGQIQNPEGVVDIALYNTDFDSLKSDEQKGAVMRMILDTLPSVFEMEAYLRSNPHAQLRSMEQVSPAAAALLQWIVSSNRSCIYQVDRARRFSVQTNTITDPTTDVHHPLSTEPAGRGRNREGERIPGMEAYIQFRFAQGSPDKEQRFLKALREVVQRKKIDHAPVLFAWHGSPLSNWHSIVRTGLDFNDTRHGRAYGHGIYFSKHYSTSSAYMHCGGASWANSVLNFSSCVSLVEIINAPDEFVSNNPHYVVNKTDWQQCRYLFVQPHTAPAVQGQQGQQGQQQKAFPTEGATNLFHVQAKGYEIIGPNNKTMLIPLAAIPRRQTTGPGIQTTPHKRSMLSFQDDSNDEDPEDLAYLFSDDEDFELGSGSPPMKRGMMSPSSSLGADAATNL